MLLRSIIIDCAGKEGPSSADLEQILSKKLPSTYNGKCVLACVGETVGMVSQMCKQNMLHDINVDSSKVQGQQNRC